MSFKGQFVKVEMEFSPRTVVIPVSRVFEIDVAKNTCTYEGARGEVLTGRLFHYQHQEILDAVDWVK